MIIIKILVISDSHGYLFNLEEILKKEYSANMIIHLGDGADEMLVMTDFTQNKIVYTIKGNCDSSAFGFPEQQTINVEDKKICACHGHRYNIKYGVEKLYFYGQSNNYDLCLFGHTHSQFSEKENGLYLFNPGAVRNGDYGIIEIQNGQIFPTLKHI